MSGLIDTGATNPGLTADEVAERVAAGQVNSMPDRSGRSVGDIIRANVFTRINAILGVLFAIVAFTGSFINGLFGLLIVANSGIGIIQEVRAKRTLDRLAIVGQTRPRVRRDGQVHELPPAEVVIDDIIEVGAGDQIVVDGEVVESLVLDVDESLLTGEADAVDKAAGDKILSGSFVVSGSGAYRATKVGADAYASQLAAEASKFTLVSSELMSGINEILKVITWLLIPAGILTIVNQLFISGNGLRASLLGMVAALVPMVPEGLVLMTSIAFAVGVVRLGRRQCLVNELPAIEGLARVNVVCADKTGTLTENGMRLSEVRGVGDAADTTAVDEVLAALAANDRSPNASVLALAEAYPQAPDWHLTAIEPFTSAKKWSGMSLADASGADRGNWILGAPDVLLDPDSAPAALASDIGANGLRVLLLGHTDVPVDTDPDAAPTESRSATTVPGTLTPVALVVLEQRVRDDARDTLDYFASQHVEVKVISGDNARSVGAVAQSLGLGSPESAVDARTLPDDPAELADVVSDGVIFGRVRPDQKRAMVAALQSRADTVAMTGDGVNDVLALKDADIGVAMGSGSSAARAVAQIVLLDNKFATLPYVVGEGRRVIGNIERVSNLFLTKTVYAVLLALFVGVAGVAGKIFGFASLSYPFQPIHVTISAWFTIGVPAFILSLAPNNERARTGFVRRVLTQAVPNGIIVGLAAFITYVIVNPGGTGVALGGDSVDLPPAQTQAATATLICLIAVALYVLAVVARPYTWWKIVLLVASVGAYVIIFAWPWTQHMFKLDSSNWDMNVVAFIAAACGIAGVEIVSRLLPRLVGDRDSGHIDGAERESLA
ncbi:putative cation-transporting ATPase [Gordonia polyisoprenivorans NBRC 16320 = JCM 10675]|uniref:HAD-IC family P-type ATPase n=1 Tax=Gordonia polyisoprenivorans TaxID=84595 RepID=A0A846WNJ7_9ACTN|nr:HAD-IC family P-type ATPase [Gordonia polyisoprenivorans]NKY03182.1 HAD-IC family P-type ATPase [Gordonia polyisoprenivorans]GAB21669.1 putative cation-transporting ATPase [Gordonia polyisoprenivorans NBRC 16320 = JCM 10675]